MARKLKDLTLTEPDKVFVGEFLKNGRNASQAFKLAYPHLTFDKMQLVNAAAAQKRKPAVSAAISIADGKTRQKLAKVMDRYAVTQERITEEMAKIAFANVDDYATWDNDGVAVKSSSDLTDATKAAISEVSETRNEKTGTTVKVKAYDKLAALTTLAKTLGMMVEKVEHKHMAAVKFIIEKD